MNAPNIKVCYVVSYQDPAYVRTRTLLAALRILENTTVYEACNTRKGWLRYPETLLKLLKIRITDKPDVYILGFRGHEIFWPVRWLTRKKPLIFDSFVSPSTSLSEESKYGLPGRLVAGLVRLLETRMLRASDHLLTDTLLHSQLFANKFGLSESRLQHIYVGADALLPEDNQETSASKTQAENKAPLSVLFYGTFLPLHGVDTILEAISLLRDRPIEFTIIGGSETRFRRLSGGHSSHEFKTVRYYPWVEFSQLRDHYIPAADVCLGGPFGNTPQASRVISGKTFQFMALGKTTIVGRIDEDVGFVDKENCLLVPRSDAQELAQALVWAQEHSNLLPDIGRNAQQHFNDNFDTPVIARRLREVLEYVQ